MTIDVSGGKDMQDELCKVLGLLFYTTSQSDNLRVRKYLEDENNIENSKISSTSYYQISPNSFTSHWPSNIQCCQHSSIVWTCCNFGMMLAIVNDMNAV